MAAQSSPANSNPARHFPHPRTPLAPSLTTASPRPDRGPVTAISDAFVPTGILTGRPLPYPYTLEPKIASLQDYTVPIDFTPQSANPGDVIIRVKAVAASQTCDTSNTIDFYCHKDVLWFASPFFKAVLGSEWKETSASAKLSGSIIPGSTSVENADERAESATNAARGISATEASGVEVPHDMATTDTSPSVADQTLFPIGPSPPSRTESDLPPSRGVSMSMNASAASNGNVEISTKHDASECISALKDSEGGGHASTSFTRTSLVSSQAARRLESLSTPPTRTVALTPDEVGSDEEAPAAERRVRSLKSIAIEQGGAPPSVYAVKETAKLNGIKAVIELPDEDATTLEGALRHVYPHLELAVTWNNCGSLICFADKYDISGLHRACLDFLRTALPGRPILAMKIADDAGLAEVYKEASRHVLDNMPMWTYEELDILSPETLLKLERKRTWFLECLLRLGLTSPDRDYSCQRGCPDSDHCAQLLQNRWHAAYTSSFRFGPPSPSMIWRNLRELDATGTGGIGLSDLAACQYAAKMWTMSLFDRTFQIPAGLGSGRGSSRFLTIKIG